MNTPETVFCIFWWIVLCGEVLGVDPFEGGFPRFQCAKRLCIKGCCKSLMEAYKETESAKEDDTINDPDTYAFLYTRRNKKIPEYLHKCGGVLPSNTRYNAEKNTVFIVHGYLECISSVMWPREMKDQFLERGDYNVILVDWGWGSRLDYYGAIRCTKVTGKQIAFLIDGIMKHTGASPDKFHIVGHCTGAHAAGIAGKHVTGGKIRRITGLDPAGPGYLFESCAERLDSSDAQYVDVIHTNGGNCTLYAFGHPGPLGHADFYPNGGFIQLSCIYRTICSFLKGDLIHGALSLVPMFCSIFQSIYYFITSINPCECQFVGVESDDYKSSKDVKSCDGNKCAVMGLDWEKYTAKVDGKHHKYYLDTGLVCPYCVKSDLNFPVHKEKPCYKP